MYLATEGKSGLVVVLADIIEGSVDAFEDALVAHRCFVPNDDVCLSKSLLEGRFRLDGALRVFSGVDWDGELAVDGGAILQQGCRDAGLSDGENLQEEIE